MIMSLFVVPMQPQVPDLARSVALQEEKFISFQDGLNHLLSRYHHALASLSESEVHTYIIY